jgi:hypothetical protein
LNKNERTRTRKNTPILKTCAFRDHSDLTLVSVTRTRLPIVEYVTEKDRSNRSFGYFLCILNRQKKSHVAVPFGQDESTHLLKTLVLFGSFMDVILSPRAELIKKGQINKSLHARFGTRRVKMTHKNRKIKKFNVFQCWIFSFES